VIKRQLIKYDARLATISVVIAIFMTGLYDMIRSVVDQYIPRQLGVWSILIAMTLAAVLYL